jgi:hypothetical protein
VDAAAKIATEAVTAVSFERIVRQPWNWDEIRFQPDRPLAMADVTLNIAGFLLLCRQWRRGVGQ